MPGFDIVGFVGLAVALIVWAIRLEGRVNLKADAKECGELDGRINAHDQLFVERGKSVTDWLDAHEQRDNERHTELRTTLIEIKASLKEAPRAIEAAQVIATAKTAADTVAAAAKVVADAVSAAAALSAAALTQPLPPIRYAPRRRK